MLALFVIVAIVVKRMIQSQGATDAKALRCDMLKDSGEVSVADTERVRKERWATSCEVSAEERSFRVYRT